jgi:hypothetical protein
MIEMKPADIWHQVCACAFAAVARLSAERSGG